jgi:hypothetical protein
VTGMPGMQHGAEGRSGGGSEKKPAPATEHKHD